MKDLPSIQLNHDYPDSRIKVGDTVWDWQYPLDDLRCKSTVEKIYQNEGKKFIYLSNDETDWEVSIYMIANSIPMYKDLRKKYLLDLIKSLADFYAKKIKGCVDELGTLV